MLCSICERGCRVSPRAVGACGRYSNQAGVMVERFPDRYLLASPISVETVPLLHFHPGAPFLQVSTIGCNFDCPGCISTVTAREMRPDSPALFHLSPADVVARAEAEGCRGIAFLMNDPLASFPTFVRVARAAKERGLLMACASNAYFTATALAELAGLLDAINIGVKGLTDQALRACGGADPEVVLRNIRLLLAGGVHVEVACMDRADNRDDTRALAATLAAIDPSLVLQLMRYVPIEAAAPALEPSIAATESLALELRKTLPNTYVFNTPGTRGLDSLCPDCGARVVVRDFYGPMGARLIGLAPGVAPGAPACARCGGDVALTGPVSPPVERERPFEGGYPFTRGLEIVEAMCLAMGATSRTEIVTAWEFLLANNMLAELHRGIQRMDGYFALVRRFGGVLGRTEEAKALVDYLTTMIEPVRSGLDGIAKRPRTYYAMGKPLFAIKGERFENHLVEVAGGHSVNRELALDGRPGRTIEAASLARLDPEVIFISSFLSNDPEAFSRECRDAGLDLRAVRDGRVHTAPVPASDFGAPKWVLGLRFLANCLHPDRFAFDIAADAAAYHRRLFGRDFPLAGINRSFAKPSSAWCFAEEAGCPSGTA
jgi:pyruvate formate lyase activating enzyme